jgi:hypothetical protein
MIDSIAWPHELEIQPLQQNGGSKTRRSPAAAAAAPADEEMSLTTDQLKSKIQNIYNRLMERRTNGMSGGKRGMSEGFAAYRNTLLYMLGKVGLPKNASVSQQLPVHRLIKSIREKIVKKHGDMDTITAMKHVKNEFDGNSGTYMSKYKEIKSDLERNPPVRKARKSSKKN